MRQPHFYSNMPPQPPYQNFPNQMPNFGYQAPPPYAKIPQGYPGPKPAPRFESFMEAANKFIATYQSFQPIISQAAPMLRNLPALWKLYRGFQSIPKEGEGKREPYSYRERPERPNYRETFESRPVRQREYPAQRENKSGVSLPRIYQPPFHY